MSTAEMILLCNSLWFCFLYWGERRLRRDAAKGWERCLRERTELAQNNYELRAKMVALAMRNEDLENQISAMQSRRYERN